MLSIPFFGSMGAQSSAGGCGVGGCLSDVVFTPSGAPDASGCRSLNGHGCGPPGSGTRHPAAVALGPAELAALVAAGSDVFADVHAAAIAPVTASRVTSRRADTDRTERIVTPEG